MATDLEPKIITTIDFPKKSNERFIPDLSKTQLKHPNRDIAKTKGELKYFTGIACKNGHLAERWVNGANCVECLKNIRIEHKKTEKYKETTKAYVKKYRPKQREMLYGLTDQQYQTMLWNQNYSCKICKERLNLDKRTHIDHCHKTKKVRGILCHNCNLGIGFFKHKSPLLREAALYCEET